VRGSNLEHLQIALRDQRSRRVVVVSHCILNENVRYLGGAGRPGSVDELVDRFQDEEVGIYQMPCPEQRAWGGVLKRYLGVAYGSKGTVTYRIRRPLTWMFVWYTRIVDARLARRVVRDIADYVRSDFVVVGVVGVGSSPSCGVFTTLDVPQSLEVIADVDAATVDARSFNAALMGTARTDGDGLFMRAIRRGLRRRHIEVPFLEHDLAIELMARERAPETTGVAWPDSASA
jgi:uncharacterized protein YbbK (DUF523 family)